MKTSLTVYLSLIFLYSSYAQDIGINFSASIRNSNTLTTLDSVKIEDVKNQTFTILKDQFKFTINKRSRLQAIEGDKHKGYPNPFNEKYIIEFLMKEEGDVSAKAFTTSGQQIADYSQHLAGGRHLFTFSPAQSGMYIIAINGAGETFRKSAVSLEGNSATPSINYRGTVDEKGTDEAIEEAASFRFTGYHNGQASVIEDKVSRSKNYTFKFNNNYTAARFAGPLTASSKFDFNGDGKEDIMKYWNDNGQFTADVHLSTGSSFTAQRWATQQGGYWDTQKWFVGDFNGDGKTDLMKCWNDEGSVTADVHLSTGSSFTAQRWATKQGGYWDTQKWFVGDFNGDGKTDLMKLWNDNGSFSADVHSSTGSSFGMGRWATQQGGYWDTQKWYVGDFNGDGKADLMKLWNDEGSFTADVHPSTGSSFTAQRWATRQGGYWDEQRWFLGDFNGDGRTDLMKFWNDNGSFTADVHPSTGSSFAAQRWATQQGGYWDTQKWLLGDFNGDGKTDLMKLWNENGSFSADVHPSTGSSFGMGRWATQQGGYWNEQRWFAGDFNGDEKTDVAKLWNDNNEVTIDVHPSNGSSFTGQRWATKQGGYWNDQKWLMTEGYVYGPGYTTETYVVGATFVLFASEYDAVKAATAAFWNNSINEHLEYGGVIYKINDANLWGYVSIKGGRHEIETNGYYPSVSEVTAYWHTHPNKESPGPSPVDVINMLGELNKGKRLYTVVYEKGKRNTPIITAIATGGRGYPPSAPQTPQEYANAAALGATVCILNSKDNQTYAVKLNDIEKSGYVSGTAGPVSVKWANNGNVWTFSIGPVGISTRGDLSIKAGGTIQPVSGSVSGRINIPAILKGDWKGIFSGQFAGGLGLGGEIEGFGLAGSAGGQVTVNFREEGPGNNWGSIIGR